MASNEPQLEAVAPRTREWHCASDSGDEQIDVRGLLRLLRRRWSWIAFGLLAGIAVAGVYCSQATTLYRSSTEVMVMPKHTSWLATAAGNSADAANTRFADDVLATHMKIISSPRIVRRAIGRLQLANLPSLVGEEDDPADYVIENLEVTRGGAGPAQPARVLNVALTHTSSEECAEILTAIVESYQDYVAEKLQDANPEAAALITRAKDDLAESLRKKAAAYREFREKTPLLWNGDETVDVHQIRQVEVETALSENRLRYAQVKSRVEIVEQALKEESLDKCTDLERMAMIDNADINRLSLLVAIERGDPASEAFRALQPIRAETASTEYDQLLALRLEAKNQQLDLGPNHPKVQEVRQSIEQLEEFLAQKTAVLGTVEDKPGIDPEGLMVAYVRLLRHDLSELDRRYQELQVLLTQEQKATKDLVASEFQGESLRRDMVRTQDLYDTVFRRLQEINLVKDYGGYITEILLPVELGEPIWPKGPATLALGGLLGILLGSGTALGLGLSDRTFRTPEDMQRSLRLPLLACNAEWSNKSRKAWRVPRGNAQPSVDPTISAFHRTRSREAESLRELRTLLFFGGLLGGHKVVQVTSPTSGDGTTTLVANLAVSMAQAGKRVLIVDADLRESKVHRLFGIDSDVGLSTYLAGDAEFQDVVKSSSCENLSVVPSGPLPSNPSDLLSQPRFDEFVQCVVDAFDFVLLDSPALLAVSDALAVAARIDAVLLHVRVVRNCRPAALRARHMLDELGAEVLGVVARGTPLDGRDWCHPVRGGRGRDRPNHEN